MNRKKITQILEFCDETGIQIVSYGLAPNPNGFCYELYGDACRDEGIVLDEMLNALTSQEEAELRRSLFG